MSKSCLILPARAPLSSYTRTFPRSYMYIQALESWQAKKDKKWNSFHHSISTILDSHSIGCLSTLFCSTNNMPDTSSLHPNCTAGCNCTSSVYEPVCGADDVVYFSPCQAGCPANLNVGGGSIHLQCLCIIMLLHISLKEFNYTNRTLTLTVLMFIILSFPHVNTCTHRVQITNSVPV